MNEETKTIIVTAYPYAAQYGTISVPKDIVSEDEIKEYVSEHWSDIQFGEPELDYVGTDFDFCEED